MLNPERYRLSRDGIRELYASTFFRIDAKVLDSVPNIPFIILLNVDGLQSRSSFWQIVTTKYTQGEVDTI